MADETFEIGFETVGEDAAVRDMQRVVQATQQVERAGTSQATAATSGARAAQTAQNTLNTTLTSGGRKWGELAGAMGNVGAVFSTVNPALGQAGSLMGAVGSASSSLSGALGPVGVGIAAITTAAGILIPLLSQMGDETDETSGDMDQMAESAKNARRELTGLITAMARQRREASIAAGAASEGAIGASIDDIQRDRERAQAQLRNAERDLAAAQARQASLERERGSSSNTGRQLAIRAEQVELEASIREMTGFRQAAEQRVTTLLTQEGERRADQMRLVMEEGLAGEEEAEERSHDRRHASSNQRRDRELEATRRWLQQMEAEGQRNLDAQEAAWQRYLGSTQDQINAWHQAVRDMDKETSQRRIDNLRVEKAEADRKAREGSDRNKAVADEQLALSNQLKGQIVEGLLGPTVDMAGELFREMAKGADLTSEAFLNKLDAFLEATAIEYTIRAAAEAALAVASAASQDYSGAAQHGVASALAGAVATATGFASVGIQTGGGSTGAPAPVSQNAGQNTSQGNNFTVNLYSPHAINTERERGAMIERARRELRREMGG